MTTDVQPDLHYIAEGLRPLAFPIDQLDLLPGNPRKGNVAAVKAMLKEFGQRKTITAKHTEDGRGIVTAGNTTTRAARELGWEYIAVVFNDEDDDKRALAWAIGDNRSHELGRTDEDALAAAMKRIDDERLLDIAGFDRSETDDIIERNQQTRDDFSRDVVGDDEEESEGDSKPAKKATSNAVIQYNLIFNDEDEQKTWYRFVRWLKNTVEGDTISERLTNFLSEIVPEDD